MRGCHAEAETEAAVSEVCRGAWPGGLLSTREGTGDHDVLLVSRLPDINEEERDRCECC